MWSSAARINLLIKMEKRREPPKKSHSLSNGSGAETRTSQRALEAIRRKAEARELGNHSYSDPTTTSLAGMALIPQEENPELEGEKTILGRAASAC